MNKKITWTGDLPRSNLPNSATKFGNWMESSVTSVARVITGIDALANSQAPRQSGMQWGCEGRFLIETVYRAVKGCLSYETSVDESYGIGRIISAGRKDGNFLQHDGRREKLYALVRLTLHIYSRRAAHRPNLCPPRTSPGHQPFR